MSDRAKEIRSKLAAASFIIENLPEHSGYNGSAFVIDDVEKDRIVKDLDEAIAFVEAAQAQAVNQQTLSDIINLMIAVKGAIKLGRGADAYNYIDAAIAAAQEGK